jgi:SET domain-containing protein
MSIADLFKKKVIGQPSGLYIADSIIHGRGVFCHDDLAIGELVEKAPLVLINKTEKELLQATILYHYYFLVGNTEYPVAIGLGYSSLYNHASHSNASYHIDLNRKLIEIKTTRAITAGEEITINYNGNPEDISPVSFPGNPI